MWNHIESDIPDDTKVVKVPHHGAINGTFYNNSTPWVDRLDAFPNETHLGISTHPNYPRRHDLPDIEVINKIEERPYQYYRTDLHYNITFTIQSDIVEVEYFHV